jgi:hypothetical protein
MLSYMVYKNIHLLGVFMVVLALGGVMVNAIVGGGKDYAWRKQAAITHGIGMFLALLGGFGLLARLGIHWPWPGWVWLKVVIWVLFGAFLTMAMRKPEGAKVLWFVTFLLAGFAAYLAGYKPF